MLGFTRALFLLLATTVLSVSGALYGTLPIGDTIWSAGRTECVSWIDDGSPPHLNEMGRFNIELFVDSHTHVATLATNASPESKIHKVKVLPSWGPNSSNYHIRFVSQHPSLIVYSADFTIRDMDPTRGNINDTTSDSSVSAAGAAARKAKAAPSGERKSAGTATPTTTSMSLYTPVITLVLPDTTITSTLAPTTPQPTPSLKASQEIAAQAALTTLGSATASPASSTASVVIDPDQDDGVRGPGEHGWTRHTGGAAGSSNRRVDMEKLKFRIVFILWPVLIGISMAL